MSRRTRDTKFGLKTRFRKQREKHGPIKRIVGDTPMVPIQQAAFDTLMAGIEQACWPPDDPAISVVMREAGVGDVVDRTVAQSLTDAEADRLKRGGA